MKTNPKIVIDDISDNEKKYELVSKYFSSLFNSKVFIKIWYS